MKRSYLHSTLLYLVVGLLAGSLLIRIFLPPYYFVKRAVPVKAFSAHELYQAVTAVPSIPSDTLAGKVILLQGLVSAVSQDYILIGKDHETIRCTFRKTIYDRKPDLRIGAEIVLKGLCQCQYMNQAVVSQCVVLNRKSPAGAEGDSPKK